MYGIDQGLPTLYYICNTLEPDIIFIQEHWQTPANIKYILHFSPNYLGYGISTMERVVQKSVLKGQPFGGSVILVNNRWRDLTKVIITSERLVIVSLGNLVFINV